MRPESSDISYLWDMLDASMAIQQFLVGKTFDNYDTDRLLRGAVERHIEIISEAAQKVSSDFRAGHPQIPWSKLSLSATSLLMNTAKSNTNVSGRSQPFIFRSSLSSSNLWYQNLLTSKVNP